MIQILKDKVLLKNEFYESNIIKGEKGKRRDLHNFCNNELLFL